MAREEKQLDMMLDAVLNRLNDLKKAVSSMIMKLETEYESINWPTFLDNFALISSHVGPVYAPPVPLYNLVPYFSSPDCRKSFPTKWLRHYGISLFSR